jgi:DNA-binding transcriptional MerR regulator
MRDRVFRGPEAARIAGITYRQLDYWARTDVVRPAVTAADGSGSVRRYSYWDLLDLYLVSRLAETGLGIPRCRGILDVVRATDFPYDKVLVLAGTDTYLVAADQLVDRLVEGPAAFVLSIPRLADDLDERIQAEEARPHLELAGA